MSVPKSWKENSTRNTSYLEAQRVAKNMGLPFTMKLADVVLAPRYPVLGLELELSRPKSNPHCPTVIMLDPALGFVPGNVRTVSHAAAELRGTAEPRDLRALADYLDRELKLEKRK